MAVTVLRQSFSNFFLHSPARLGLQPSLPQRMRALLPGFCPAPGLLVGSGGCSTLSHGPATPLVVVFEMSKRGVEGPWVSVDQPPLPTSMPGAGQNPGKRALIL